MSEPTKTSHHHGNLKEALVEAGIAMLEEGEPFSLRAVARRVGVSQAAPYRHFANKESLEAAMATHGFATLHDLLEAEIAKRSSELQLVDLALVYVNYAVAHPALYALMFSQMRDGGRDRPESAKRLFALLERVSEKVAPTASPHGLATAGWAIAHGLASLHLDGELAATPGDSLEARVREAFIAISR